MSRIPSVDLRIGYVSPDFRDHVDAFFIVPLLSHHDHGRFEIFCYAQVAYPDAMTDRLRGYADAWRNISGLSDQQAADLVRHDRIDILVDLKLHTADNRLLLFARKPAPVQVSWLGYPGTTGLSTIDYRLTDPDLDPPGLFDAFYSEESLRLPDTFWCYDPLTDEPAVNALPGPAVRLDHLRLPEQPLQGQRRMPGALGPGAPGRAGVASPAPGPAGPGAGQGPGRAAPGRDRRGTRRVRR